MGCLFYALKSVVLFVKFNCKPVLNLNVIESLISNSRDHAYGTEIQIAKFILNWLKRGGSPVN